MELFGVGIPEMGMILLVMLLVVGPNRFPQVAREAGKWYRIARAYADDVMRDVRGAMDELEQEVTKPAAEDLRSIREIGTDLGTDVRRIGDETRDAAADDRADGTR